MISENKMKFLKRRIYKTPCNMAGCKTILHTRIYKKYCKRHNYLSQIPSKLSKKNIKKRRMDLLSPYNLNAVDTKICLKCKKKFESQSKYNRICYACNGENDVMLAAKKCSNGDGTKFKKKVNLAQEDFFDFNW